MDYMDVPKEVLDLAVKVSKAANAEYWACDIAVAKKDGSLRILECATAFAAFPYIRDWIGQYLMWLLSDGRFKKPNIPIYNWEELGKIDSSLLRTMRYITFGKYTPSFDGEYFLNKQKVSNDGEVNEIWELDQKYPMEATTIRAKEEWPSEKWDFTYQCKDFYKNNIKKEIISNDETSDNNHIFETPSIAQDDNKIEFDEKSVIEFMKDNLGKKKYLTILEQIDAINFAYLLDNNPQELLQLKGIKEKTLDKLINNWS
jgi:hypothetical protein